MRILAAAFAITGAVGVLTGCGKPEPAKTADGKTVVRYQGQTGQVTHFEPAADLGYFSGIDLHWGGGKQPLGMPIATTPRRLPRRRW
ncbi:hypothetical protein [Nocardia acidivorans]|uniref:hypothetical protein n=1 Tax=Nocardia acidivorans TaxID=404580 RepID=UPI00082DC15B|nr:hypothetical protein [Nocardia acidivorans]